MELIRARDFAKVREKFIEVIAKTPDMKKYARWDYGLHPTDEMIQGYMDRGEMFMYMEGNRIAGMAAITMYQGEDYRDISWDISLDNDQLYESLGFLLKGKRKLYAENTGWTDFRFYELVL